MHLIENEATSDARLQVRGETAGRIFASLPVHTFGEFSNSNGMACEDGESDDKGGEYVTVSATTETSFGEEGGDKHTCCICIDEYAAGDKIATLPCGHQFHCDCIKPWLQQQCVCPLCKRDLLEGTDEDAAVFNRDAFHRNAPIEGWRAFLELVLESQFADSRRGGTRRSALLEQHPPVPPPPFEVDEDGETFVVNFDTPPPLDDVSDEALERDEAEVVVASGAQ